jgi:hypothetical protein
MTRLLKILMSPPSRIIIFAALGSFALSLAAYGAGGIVRDGKILTLGSSGIQVELSPLSSADLPELSMAVNGVRGLVLPNQVMGSILKELRPSPSRAFFKVQRITNQQERSLVQAFKEILPELDASDRFTLFGFTDPAKKETFSN